LSFEFAEGEIIRLPPFCICYNAVEQEGAARPMQPLAHDTAPHIEADLIARLRGTPAWRKFQMIAGLHHGAARIVRMGVRRRRPQASDAAWRYVQAILRVQADALDQAYLRRWAAELSVGDLLEVALRGERPPAPGADPRQQRLF
jgi:hypothetical protein